MEFLDAIKPKIALIEVGKNNKFGHPADITLENLKSIGSKIYRTDLNGEISIQVQKQKKNLGIIINTMIKQK